MRVIIDFDNVILSVSPELRYDPALAGRLILSFERLTTRLKQALDNRLRVSFEAVASDRLAFILMRSLLYTVRTVKVSVKRITGGIQAGGDAEIIRKLKEANGDVALVSGDSDFFPILRELKDQRKRVMFIYTPVTNVLKLRKAGLADISIPFPMDAVMLLKENLTVEPSGFVGSYVITSPDAPVMDYWSAAWQIAVRKGFYGLIFDSGSYELMDELREATTELAVMGAKQGLEFQEFTRMAYIHYYRFIKSHGYLKEYRYRQMETSIESFKEDELWSN